MTSLAFLYSTHKLQPNSVYADYTNSFTKLLHLSNLLRLPVNEDLANKVSMFIAQATPMASVLTTSFNDLQRQVAATQFLADFAHICCAVIMNDRVRLGENCVFFNYKRLRTSTLTYNYIYK